MGVKVVPLRVRGIQEVKGEKRCRSGEAPLEESTEFQWKLGQAGPVHISRHVNNHMCRKSQLHHKSRCWKLSQ